MGNARVWPRFSKFGDGHTCTVVASVVYVKLFAFVTVGRC